MISKIIQETGHEGEIHGCMQILSKHPKKDMYYTRVAVGEGYAIALIDYEAILNCVYPRKFQTRLFKNPYWHLSDGSTVLFDVHGKEIIIDTEDFDRLYITTWCSAESNDGYVIGNIKDELGITYRRYIHQVIMGTEMCDRDIQVDHIDLDVLNNKKINLRICNNRTNNMNKQIHQSIDSDMIGLIDVGNGKFKAVIKYNGSKLHLGTGTIDQAKMIRKIVMNHIDSYGIISIEQLAMYKKQVGILNNSAETQAYCNNELGLKGIRMDKRNGTYQVRINFKDGRGTIYCGSRKKLEDAIALRNEILSNFNGGN